MAIIKNNMDIIERLGIRIKTLRKSLGLTQEKLAELCGLSDNFIGKAERGYNAPSIMTLERIAKALKVPLSELFHFLDEDINNSEEEEALSELICLLKGKGVKDIKFISDFVRKLFERDKEKNL